MRYLAVLCLTLLALLAATTTFAAKLDPPNLRLDSSPQTYVTGAAIKLSLSTYNIKRVTLAAYRIDITSLIPNASVLDAGENQYDPNGIFQRIRKLRLSSPVKSWSVKTKMPYPNNWEEQTIKLPALGSGVYVIEARGGGITKRTWLAITSRALVVKRSDHVVKAWLVNANTGQPVAGVPIAAASRNGTMAVVSTGRDGIATIPADYRGTLWFVARGSEPAFAYLAGLSPEDPYTIYTYPDRPLYRPGQIVKFRGVVRAVKQGTYLLPSEKTVSVQINSPNGVPVYNETLPLNDWGAFSAEFALADEPPLGSYSLQVKMPGYDTYTGFEVEAYRKPEFEVTATIPKQHYPGGTAIPVTIGADYFFGSPVSGGKVHYRVNFNQYGDGVPARVITAAGLGSAAMARVEEDYEGEGVLDDKGKLTLSIPTRNLAFDRSLSVYAEVTDLSLRQQSASVNTLITAAQFRLGIGTNDYTYQPGDTVRTTVYAHDYDNKPVANATATVTFIEQRTDRAGRPREERTTRQVTTDAEGKAVTTFQPLRPGHYEAEVWGMDADRNPVYARTSFEVVTKKPQPTPNWPTLELSTDKEKYTPGETANIRVRTSLTGAWALLTIEGQRIYRCEVIRLQAKDFTLKVPILPEYRQGVTFRLTVVRGSREIPSSCYLNVPATDKQLTVILTPTQTTYQPGEEAAYDLTVRDQRGRGVAAELGLGVVDTALYALHSDSTPNPFDVFWHAQDQRVADVFSFAVRYPSGESRYLLAKPIASYRMAMSAPIPTNAFYSTARHAEINDMRLDMAEDDGFARQEAGPRVRQNFADVAFWAPSVQTGPDGLGQIKFTLPDNLTTWRATARAVDKASDAGQGTHEVTVTMPLLVRLTLPRFYVQHDEATAAAIVHNYTGADRQVHVVLSAEGAEIIDTPEQTVTIPANGIKRLTWKMRVNGDGDAIGTRQNVRILVSADGGDTKDAMESIVPLLPDGVRRVEGKAGVLSNANGNGAEDIPLTLPAQMLPGSAQVEVTLSPSLAGPIFESLDYLVEYPYGCAEQTMDRFLPAIIVARTLRTLGAQRPAPKNLSRDVNFGLQKLLRYQHGDGGWHWWEDDQSDPYITAYIVYGLAMARNAGYPQAAGPLPRGVAYLSQFMNQADAGTRAYMLWALAYADVWPDNTLAKALNTAHDLYKQRARMDIYSRASLALALDRLGKTVNRTSPLPEMAKTIADELEREVVVSGTASHWTDNAGERRFCGSWLDSDVEVTAHVLQTLLALKPDSPQIPAAVRWLMATRQGKAWNSTKDTAAAVLALTAYLQQAKELSPNETVIVSIGDKTLKTITLGKEQLFADPIHITVPASELQPGANTLRLMKTGAGNLYWSAHVSYLLPEGTMKAETQGITVKRSYSVVTENPVEAGLPSTGKVIAVTTTITADQNYRYLTLEEPIPAGCEIISNEVNPVPYQEYEDYSPYQTYTNRQYYHREVWDDRIMYYFDNLPKGTQEVTYLLYTESPGEFRIRPSVAALVYFPEVRGEGKFARIRIKEE